MPPEQPAMTSTPVLAPTKMSVLLRRLLSTAVLWLVVIAALVIGWPPGIFAFTAVAALIAFHEFFCFLEHGGLRVGRRARLTVGILFFSPVLPIIFSFCP